MQITEAQRQHLETALDRLYIAAEARCGLTLKDGLAYLKAIAMVRDRPAGTRRVRSDLGQKRATVAQIELPAVE